MDLVLFLHRRAGWYLLLVLAFPVVAQGASVYKSGGTWKEYCYSGPECSAAINDHWDSLKDASGYVNFNGNTYLYQALNCTDQQVSITSIPSSKLRYNVAAWGGNNGCQGNGSYYIDPFEEDPNPPVNDDPPDDPEQHCLDKADKTVTLPIGSACSDFCTVTRATGQPATFIDGMSVTSYRYTGGTCQGESGGLDQGTPVDDNGCISTGDLSSGLSLMCSFAEQEPIPQIPPDYPPETDPESCFSAYDVNGDPAGEYCTDGQDGDACWLENGRFYCAGEDYAGGFGCTLIDGYMACYASNPETGEPEPIDPDSPDNPANGGNANGDPTDDIFDPGDDGQVPGGGYGYEGSGQYAQEAPSTADTLQAGQIGTAVDNALRDDFQNLNETLEGLGGEGNLAGSYGTEDGSINSAPDGLKDGLDSEAAEMVTDINASDTVQSVQELRQAFANVGSGTCPDLSFDLSGVPLIGRTVGTTIHCELYDDYRPVLETVFALIWFLAAARHFMSA